MCCAAVSELEKKTTGLVIGSLHYSLAVTLLQCLLNLPFRTLLHRRGRWFERLCVDLEHCAAAAAATAVAAADKEESSYSFVIVDAGSCAVKYLSPSSSRTLFLRYSLLLSCAALDDPLVRVRM